jgi:integrase
MPELVTRALAQHQQRQRQERDSAAGAWIETGLVFTTATGRHMEPRNLSTAFRRLLSRSGVRPIRLHDLRHTCATLLLARGVSARVVMDVLGHSQIAVTMNIYGHVIPAMQQSAANEIDAALGDEQEPLAVGEEQL